MSRPRPLEPLLCVDVLHPQVRRGLGRLTDVAGASSASASEWAASVDSTSVRWPAAALAHAVAAARVDLPTPPLPVNSRIRMPGPRVRATRRAS